MRSHDRVMPVDLAAPDAKIANQFFARVELHACRLIAIEIADQTNAERDVVQIIAVHVPAVDLTAPTIAHFDLAIARRCAVANDKMIRQSILHVANMTMVIIENARVTLPCAAVVDDDVLPATP